MPIQAQWTEFLCCPVCCHEFAANQRSPISLGCGHTVCRTCLANLHRKQCPFDQIIISTDINLLPVNSALLQLVNPSTLLEQDISEIRKCLGAKDLACYQQATKCIEELALYLKPFTNGSSSILSRPMQRKLLTLVNCQLMEDEGRSRSLRAARSLGERTVTELILQHQNPQQLSANLWAGVRARGCQFLGPAMQEEVLKLVLLALEDGSALSRKVLVMFVVQRLEPHFPQASKTSIGHVVQLLYRASCFKVSKRDGDSSLMQLKEEFRTYEALRREHDAQIVQIATEAGLRIAPDQWSALLYGDTAHKSHMQSIIDKLQTPQSFAQSVQELVIALQRTGDPANLSVLRKHLELLAAIDPSTESTVPNWQECSESLTAVSQVVVGLVDFIVHHGNRKQLDSHNNHNIKYKISMCRDLTLRNSCPRGINCTFAHSEDELDKYRAKNRKVTRTPGKGSEEQPVNFINPIASVGMPMPTIIEQGVTSNAQTNAEYSTYNSAYQNRMQMMYPQRLPGSNEGFSPQGVVLSPSKQPNTQYQHPFRMDSTRLQNWDNNYGPNNPTNYLQQNYKKPLRTLAALQQRKQDIISQLERVVGITATSAIISNSRVNSNGNNVQSDEKPGNANYWETGLQFNHLDAAQVFVRSDSILTDDDYVPFEAPSASKFGPISRMNRNRTQYENQSRVAGNAGNTIMVNDGRKPTAPWILSQAGYHPPISTPSISDAYIKNIDSGLTLRTPDSQDLLAESHRVKQLRNLERKILDRNVSQNEGEEQRLLRELKLVEQGIYEKEKERESMITRLNSPNSSIDIQYPREDEESYEEGIAHEMRELELRLANELEEHENKWINTSNPTTPGDANSGLQDKQ